MKRSKTIVDCLYLELTAIFSAEKSCGLFFILLRFSDATLALFMVFVNMSFLASSVSASSLAWVFFIASESVDITSSTGL